MPKRIPVKALRAFSKEQGLTHAILFACDGERQHIVTYGKNVEQCSQAADFGNKMKRVMKWPESLQQEPSKVKKLQQEIASLKEQLDKKKESKQQIKLSIKQLREIKHALGGKIEEGTYRNYYNAGEVCESWEELVEMGFATKRDHGKSFGGIYYYVTDKAIDFLRGI